MSMPHLGRKTLSNILSLIADVLATLQIDHHDVSFLVRRSWIELTQDLNLGKTRVCFSY